MRKPYWALALALLHSPVFAQEANLVGQGFYGGPVLGVDGFAGDETDDGQTGVVYGGVIGYDVTVGGAVLGVETEFTDSSVGESEASFLIPGDSLRLGIGADLYLGARAGLRVGTSGLVYLKGGYTSLDLDADYRDPSGFEVNATRDFDGYRLGAGAEFALARNLMARVEYRYSNYDGGDRNDPFADLEFDRHQGIAGLLFRF